MTFISGQPLKGLALVKDKDDFENFVMDFFVFDNSVFEELSYWYEFFCGGEMIYLTGCEPDITQLIEELEVDLIPETYPAFVVFDFEDYRPPYMVREDVIFETFSVADLNIRKIETKDGDYSIAYAESL